MWLRDNIDIGVARNASTPISLQFIDEYSNEPVDLTDYSASMSISTVAGTPPIANIDVVIDAPLDGGLSVTLNGSDFSEVDGVDAFRVNNVRVVAARRTGWGSPTGTASRVAFDTSTATTADLAQRLKALIDDLIAHGLIGA